jgi:CNP1-like family
MRWLLLLCAAMAAQAAAQNTNDPREASGPQQERHFSDEGERRGRQEGALALPAWPKDENLIEFYVNSTGAFRFFIDAASVSVGSDRVVRYTVIARSTSGVVNVNYEGIRCDSGTYKAYAYGQNGHWTVRDSEWRDIDPQASARWQQELRASYFCVHRTGTIFTAQEGVDALRRGGRVGAAGRQVP